MSKTLPETYFALNRMNTLVIRSGMTIRLMYPSGEPVANASFTLYQVDGTELKDKLDEQGECKLKQVTEGEATLVFDQGAALEESEFEQWQQENQSA